MATYRFRTTITVFGHIDREIGDQDPEEAADEILEEMPSTNDLTFIGDHETEITDWDKL